MKVIHFPYEFISFFWALRTSMCPHISTVTQRLKNCN